MSYYDCAPQSYGKIVGCIPHSVEVQEATKSMVGRGSNRDHPSSRSEKTSPHIRTSDTKRAQRLVGSYRNVSKRTNTYQIVQNRGPRSWWSCRIGTQSCQSGQSYPIVSWQTVSFEIDQSCLYHIRAHQLVPEYVSTSINSHPKVKFQKRKKFHDQLRMANRGVHNGSQDCGSIVLDRVYVKCSHFTFSLSPIQGNRNLKNYDASLKAIKLFPQKWEMKN